MYALILQELAAAHRALLFNVGANEKGRAMSHIVAAIKLTAGEGIKERSRYRIVSDKLMWHKEQREAARWPREDER